MRLTWILFWSFFWSREKIKIVPTSSIAPKKAEFVWAKEMSHTGALKLNIEF